MNVCVMEGCDQEPQYCVGHFEEEMRVALVANSAVQGASLIIRALLTRLEREGLDNADMAAARDWLCHF